jgi:hypothetical protein
MKRFLNEVLLIIFVVVGVLSFIYGIYELAHAYVGYPITRHAVRGLVCIALGAILLWIADGNTNG